MAVATSSPPTTPVTLDEYEGHYEIIDGKVVETPAMGAFEGWIASELNVILGSFAKANRLGIVVVETLFLIDRGRDLQRRPDLAFISADRWPINRRVPRTAAWDVIPDLAVEVISPTNTAKEVMDKLAAYFRAGVRLVWVVYPNHEQVYVYDSPTSVRILKVGNELDGGAVLPGFRLPLTELFVPEAETPPAP